MGCWDPLVSRPIMIHVVHPNKDSEDEDENEDDDDYGFCTYGSCIMCGHIGIGMVTIVINGNVRIQVQFVWTQSTQSRKIKGGIVIAMIAIDRQLTCMKVGMAIVTADDCQ
jgi:hypothetical protein